MASGLVGIRVNGTGWPVLRVFVGVGIDEANTLAFVAELAAFIARAEPFVVVFDHHETEVLSPRVALAANDAMRPLFPGMKAHCAGFCSITPNPVIRAIVRGTLRLVGIPVPAVVVSTVDDAELWVQHMLPKLGPVRLDAKGSGRAL